MPSDPDTDDVFVSSHFAETFFARPSPTVRFAMGAATHPGLVRTNNEDHFLVSRRSRSHEVLWTNMPADAVPAFVDEDFLILVADGIGGEAFGEVASRLLLQSVWELTALATSWAMKFTDFEAQEFSNRIHAYVERAERQLKQSGRRSPPLTSAGTTMTAALLMGRDVVIVNVGDSRAYVCRGDSCRQVTRDHTAGQSLMDMGIPSEDIGRLHHVLINSFSLDAKSRAVPDVYHERLHDGDRLLVCTDGLTDMLSDEEIAATIESQPHIQAACDALIQGALDKGGRDNITLALARIRILDEPSATPDPHG